ncbi:MAG TPA: hypothetical protein VFU54_11640 [Actinomycetota bacterium]|nr:hypothetical protein [Actinomycetota bacterium]
MVVAVLRDAWRQYRRRPLAAVVAVAVGGLPVFVDPRTALVAVPLTVGLLVAGLLVELFLVAWLAGALAPVPTAAADALAAVRRSIGPAVRAWLLRVGYLLLALLVGLLLFGPRDSETLPRPEQTKLAIGLWPLFGFALAFLAVLMQPVVLDRQRRLRQAAAVSHRVAAANFPLCLLIGLAQASGLVLTSFNLRFTVMAVLAIVLALGDPFLVGMSNALYLRAKAAAEAAQAGGGGALRPPRR